ncbi:MAG: efflux RND transporter periplasmic adaptor subunit [Variibacter sp.]|nr:efflux RND transporter periplasmic adaptor subunit [Variibacter sp.]
MSKRAWLIAGAAIVGLAGVFVATREWWAPPGAVAEAPAQPRNESRVVPVETAKAVRMPVPVTLEALGTVTPIASVAIKSRLETEIVGVHFEDGAAVKKGDLLFTLDSRALEAQIRQAEGILARDKAQLEGAQRDLRRYTELLAKNAGTAVNVENAKTQVDMLTGTVKADESALQNLRVQLSYTKIYAPISGRISAAAVRVGNFVRPADPAPLATVNQTKPVYVTFGVPQRALAEIREAMAAGTARVEATMPGAGKTSVGKLAMIENTVDAASGMITVRAIMDNEDEALWPGTLVNVVLTLRAEEAVTVPSVAVQTGQRGNYVFVVDNGVAEVRPVKMARTAGGDAVIGEGLRGGETVVVDGQLLLTNGTKVAPRQAGRAQTGS